ncbi:MAG: helix-turn-helix transcriptional regulator [Acidimicrobiales bacterium]
MSTAVEHDMKPADWTAPGRSGVRPVPLHRAVSKSNLPLHNSSFVGRERDILEVAALLRDDRLVTLSGIGGMGKTRLALEVARVVGNRYDDGVWFVELAAVVVGELVVETVRAVLPSSVVAASRTIDLVDLLRHRELLLVLDNCEHLTADCAALAQRLLRSCPDLSVLATSRNPLRVAGERVWSLTPLRLPGHDDLDSPTLCEAEAVQLFVDRARAVHPDFRLDAEVAPAVAEICHRLDGLPLAIELAAARLAVLSPAEIVERLEDRFLLLRGAVGAQRHQTLEAAFNWSHELLSAAEATLLRRLAVFTGGWTLKAAEGVCSGGGITREAVLDLLDALVAKSLVVVDRGRRMTRYRMLDSLRFFAQSKLEASGEAEERRLRHAEWCLELARQADEERHGRRHESSRQAIEDDQDNLRAALAWARARGRVEIVLALAADLTWFWECKGQLREGLDWLKWAISRDEGADAGLIAKALRGTGMLSWLVGDVAAALPLVDESVVLFHEAGNEEESTGCVCSKAMQLIGDPAHTLPALHDHVAHMRDCGDMDRLAHALVNCGVAHFFVGEAAAARHCFEECLLLSDGGVDPVAVSGALFGLGRVKLLQGELDGAEAEFRAGLELSVRATDRDGRSTALSWIGEIARVRGDYRRARSLIGDALELVAEEGPALSVARCKQFLARVAQSDGALDEAKALYLESLAEPGATDMPYHRVRSLQGLGETAASREDLCAAQALLAEAVELAQSNGDLHAVGQAVSGLATVARAGHDPDRAMKLQHRALEVREQIGDQLGLLTSVESVAMLAAAGEHGELAVRLLAAAEAARQQHGTVRPPAEERQVNESITAARARLGERAFAKAWDQGGRMSLAESASYAARGRGSKMRPAKGWDSLSRAERDIVRLVIEGMTNQEISEKLFISARTVGTHLTHVYRKLGVRSRRELAREASQRTMVA